MSNRPLLFWENDNVSTDDVEAIELWLGSTASQSVVEGKYAALVKWLETGLAGNCSESLSSSINIAMDLFAPILAFAFREKKEEYDEFRKGAVDVLRESLKIAKAQDAYVQLVSVIRTPISSCCAATTTPRLLPIGIRLALCTDLGDCVQRIPKRLQMQFYSSAVSVAYHTIRDAFYCSNEFKWDRRFSFLATLTSIVKSFNLLPHGISRVLSSSNTTSGLVGLYAYRAFLSKLLELLIPSAIAFKKKYKNKDAVIYAQGKLEVAALLSSDIIDSRTQEVLLNRYSSTSSASLIASDELLSEVIEEVRKSVKGKVKTWWKGTLRCVFFTAKQTNPQRRDLNIDFTQGTVTDYCASSGNKEDARLELDLQDFVAILLGRRNNPIIEFYRQNHLRRTQHLNSSKYKGGVDGFSITAQYEETLEEFLILVMERLFQVQPDLIFKLRRLPMDDMCSIGCGDVEVNALNMSCQILLLYFLKDKLWHRIPPILSSEFFFVMGMKATLVLLSNVSGPSIINTKNVLSKDEEVSSIDVLRDNGFRLFSIILPIAKACYRENEVMFTSLLPMAAWLPEKFVVTFLQQLCGIKDKFDRQRYFNDFSELLRLFNRQCRYSLYLHALDTNEDNSAFDDVICSAIVKVFKEDLIGSICEDCDVKQITNDVEALCSSQLLRDSMSVPGHEGVLVEVLALLKQIFLRAKSEESKVFSEVAKSLLAKRSNRRSLEDAISELSRQIDMQRSLNAKSGKTDEMEDDDDQSPEVLLPYSRTKLEKHYQSSNTDVMAQIAVLSHPVNANRVELLAEIAADVKSLTTNYTTKIV